MGVLSATGIYDLRESMITVRQKTRTAGFVMAVQQTRLLNSDRLSAGLDGHHGWPFDVKFRPLHQRRIGTLTWGKTRRLAPFGIGQRLIVQLFNHSIILLDRSSRFGRGFLIWTSISRKCDEADGLNQRGFPNQSPRPGTFLFVLFYELQHIGEVVRVGQRDSEGERSLKRLAQHKPAILAKAKSRSHTRRLNAGKSTQDR